MTGRQWYPLSDGSTREKTHTGSDSPSYNGGNGGTMDVVCGVCERRRPAHEPDCGCGDSPTRTGNE